jgi:RHS repeat-associated protein
VRGSSSADYTWGYGSKLIEYDSDFIGEATVNYAYGGDGKRRERDVTGGEYTWYNWDVGYNVINEEDDLDTLTNTYTVSMKGTTIQLPGLPEEGTMVSVGTVGSVIADSFGDDPSIDNNYRFYMHDHLGTTRSIFDISKTNVGSFEATPFGGAMTNDLPDSLTHRYAGYETDASSGNYFTAYRYYNSDTTRWLSRDPLGMADGPNVYAFVGNSPASKYDKLGLLFGLFGPPTDLICGFIVGGVNFTGFRWLDWDKPNDNQKHCITGCRIMKLCGFSANAVANIAFEIAQALKNWNSNKFNDWKEDFVAAMSEIGTACRWGSCKKACRKRFP